MGAGILVVEDEEVLARNLRRFLERQGHSVRIAPSIAEGWALFDAFQPDLVLLDVKLPDGSGLDLLDRILGRDRSRKVVVMTAHGNVQVAVDAMKRGAHDFLQKPMPLDEVRIAVERALGQERMEHALSYYQARAADGGRIDALMGASEPMQALRQRIAMLCAAEARLTDGIAPPALILGETGTGKELVARALHFDGPRAKHPFVALNCAALPANLIESELFGAERGAFTDAKERRIGLIEAADGGSLFLDEIGELDLGLQAKLLKAIEDRSIRRIGAVRDRAVDVRFLAATHRGLEAMAAEGRFRADLFYRLRVVTLELPPLRARTGDLELLARHFLAVHARRYGRPGLRLGEDALEAMARHRWPGNVRELRNVIEQAVLLATGETIGAGHLALPAMLPAASESGSSDTLPGAEKAMIQRALAASAGNVSQAARVLGISRDTLRYRLDKHGLRHEGD